MSNDAKGALTYLRSRALMDIKYVEPEFGQERLLEILRGVIDVMFILLERLDTYEHEISVDSVQERFQNINISLCKVCKDIEDLKNEAVFRSVL